MRFAPMLADDASSADISTVVVSSDWALEPKINGHRRVIAVADGIASGFNRNGEPASIPHSVSAELALFVTDAILDGELVGNMWVCFDLLVLDGESMLGRPWARRRAKLEKLFDNRPGGAVRLVTAARTDKQKHKLILRVKELHGEGLVAKDVHAGYHPGRHRFWLKLKHTKTVDCVVMFFGQDKQNVSVGLYRSGDTEPTVIAEVSRLTGDGRKVVFASFLRLWMGLLGIDVPPVVVEVTCLYCSREYKLVQPVTPRLRTDKTAAECTFDQLETLIPIEHVI